MNRKYSVDESKSLVNILGDEDGWNDEKTKELLSKMKKIIGKDDVSKYKTSLERFDWAKVSFGPFSGEDCQKQFFRVYKKLRKYKTLSDLVADSLEYIENPYKGNIKKHPDHPKRPLTPYFRFFLSEREKYAAEHKELSNLEITSILSRKYKEISKADKNRYMEEWKQEMVSYRKKLEQFKQDHPEYYDKSPPRISRTPMQIYNIENSLDTPTSSKKKSSAKDQKKYHDLDDGLKLPYILKAIEDWEKYKEELEMHKKTHPDFVPTSAQTKCTLTQSDWRIHDKSLGKPDRPPANGYNLFCTRMMVSAGMKHLTSRERIVECGQKWKLLTESEKQAYQAEFINLRNTYRTEIKNFMKSLTPRQRHEFLERTEGETKKTPKRKSLSQVKQEVVHEDASTSEEPELDDDTSSESSSSESSDDEDEDEVEEVPKKKSKSSKVATISSPSHRPTTPISALFLYQKAHKEKFAAKHPNASKSDITIMLARRFNNLPKEKKAKWIQQEKEQRALHNDRIRKRLLEEEKARIAPAELKPVTGEQIFQEQNKGIYLKKANGSVEKSQDLMRHAWTSMNKDRRKKYITVAHEQNARNIAEHQAAKEAVKDTMIETHAQRVPIEKKLSQKEIKSYLKTEPKKVPANALALFKVEQKLKLTHLRSSARNQEISRLWSSMTTTAKNQFKVRAKASLTRYNKKLDSFVKTLPPQAHKAYQALLEKRTKEKAKASKEKDSVTNGKTKKRKADLKKAGGDSKKAKLLQEESEDSSDESSDDDGDSSSSSDDSDDESDSSSSGDDSSSDSDSTESENEKTTKKVPAAKADSSDGSSSSSDGDSDSD